MRHQEQILGRNVPNDEDFTGNDRIRQTTSRANLRKGPNSILGNLSIDNAKGTRQRDDDVRDNLTR